jgi:Rrf2 family protein
MSYPYFQLSKKSDYAIRGLMELALRGDGEPVNVRTLAESQDIPARFLEIILNELKQGGFVLSTRGKSGGYLLARYARDITIGQIIRFLDQHSETEPGIAGPVPHHGDFVLPSILNRVNQSISDICDGTTLEDMVAEHMKNQEAFTSSYMI